jgi:hypothetical protein
VLKSHQITQVFRTTRNVSVGSLTTHTIRFRGRKITVRPQRRALPPYREE